MSEQQPHEATTNLLAGYVEQAAFAKQYAITPRTVARYRDRGLPWLEFGGKIFIPIREAGEWLNSLVRHPNQPQKPRRASAT